MQVVWENAYRLTFRELENLTGFPKLHDLRPLQEVPYKRWKTSGKQKVKPVLTLRHVGQPPWNAGLNEDSTN